MPTLLACIWTKTPIMIHEQNVYVGKINKLFGRFATKIMISYRECYGIKYKDTEKVIYTGSPVRKDIKELYNSVYNYPDDKFTVLITGGSGGAKIFSEHLPKIFDTEHKERQKMLKVYHQVREEYVSDVIKYYRDIGLDAEVSTFFSNIKDLLMKANLIIGRAGSGTLCEIAICGIPSILIPFPSAANNHQEINARNFEKQQAGIVILEKDFDVKTFQTLFFSLIDDKDRLLQLSKNAKQMAVIAADDNIMNVINDFFAGSNA